MGAQGQRGGAAAAEGRASRTDLGRAAPFSECWVPASGVRRRDPLPRDNALAVAGYSDARDEFLTVRAKRMDNAMDQQEGFGHWVRRAATHGLSLPPKVPRKVLDSHLKASPA